MSDMEIRELVRSLIRQHLFLHGHVIHSLCLSAGLKHGLSKPSPSVSLLSSTTAASPNLIDIDDMRRIGTGEETRTTLMIKRIPRKYTLELLRQEIDSVMDSAKMTNRGYAFVNFTCSRAVDVFVGCFSDRSWMDLNKRNKTAVICWANVQGREATLAHIKTTEQLDLSN